MLQIREIRAKNCFVGRKTVHAVVEQVQLRRCSCANSHVSKQCKYVILEKKSCLQQFAVSDAIVVFFTKLVTHSVNQTKKIILSSDRWIGHQMKQLGAISI